MGEERGRRRHIIPHLVCSICEFQLVESLLKGRLSTGYHGEQTLRRLRDIEGSVRLPIKDPRRAVRVDEGQSPSILVDVLFSRRIPRPLAWLRLPIGRGDPLKVDDVVHLRHGANRAPRRKSLVRDLYHRGEALGGKIAQAG